MAQQLFHAAHWRPNTRNSACLYFLLALFSFYCSKHMMRIQNHPLEYAARRLESDLGSFRALLEDILESRKRTSDSTLRCVSMIVNTSSIMPEKSVKASIVRLEGLVTIPKMPFTNSMRFVSNFFQILWKQFFFCAHSNRVLERNRIRSKTISKSITTSQELSAGRTASEKGLFDTVVIRKRATGLCGAIG